MEERLREVEKQTALLPDMNDRLKRIDQSLHGERGLNVRVDRLEQRGKFMDKISWAAFVSGVSLLGKWLWEHLALKALLIAVKIIPLFTILLFIVSCIPSREEMRCNKADKKIRKAIVKCPSVLQADTITITDTVYVEGVRADTIIKTNFDSIFIDKERLHIKLVRRDSLIYVTGDCDPITAIKEIKVADTFVRQPEKKISWLKIMGTAACFALIGFLIWVFWKEKNRENKND